MVTFEDHSQKFIDNSQILMEIHNKLETILAKTVQPNENLNKFTQVKVYTIETINELVFYISSKIDDI